MNNSNIEVRVALLRAGLHQWELAGLLRIRETAFTKLLSKELPDDVQEALVEAIECVDDLEAFREVREDLQNMLTEVSSSRYADRIMHEVEETMEYRKYDNVVGYSAVEKLGGRYD